MWLKFENDSKEVQVIVNTLRETGRSLIEEIAEISATVPDEEWREEPRNASKRVGEEAPCLCDQITFSQCWVIATRPYVGKIIYDKFYHDKKDADQAFIALELSPEEYHVYSVLIGFEEKENPL